MFKYGFLLLVLNYIINRNIYMVMYYVRFDLGFFFFIFYYVCVFVIFMFKFKMLIVED